MSSFVAVIHKDEGSEYGVSFPDFPGCITAGKTLQEAKFLAEEALSLHIKVMLEDGDELPKASELDNLNLDEDDKDSIKAFLIVEHKYPAQKRIQKRINITLDERLVEKADILASKHHASRSGLIADLINKEIV